jgi:hypothetical protein
MGKINGTQRKQNCYKAMEKRVRQHCHKRHRQRLPQLRKIFNREISLPLTPRKEFPSLLHKVQSSSSELEKIEPIKIDFEIVQKEIETLQNHLQLLEEQTVALEKRIQNRIRELEEEITQL